MTDLTGHVALVTGGSTGIGLGIVHGLLAAGASVAFCSRHGGRNQTAMKGFENTDRVAAFVCDVREEDQVDRLVADTLEQFGRLDSCFANAGIGGDDVAFTDCTLEQWREVHQTNLDGTFLTCRAAARHMVDAYGGSIVVTSSTAAVAGRPRGQAYAASKAGIHALIRGMAVELARHGVRANAILPGWFGTPLTQDFLEADVAQRKILPRIPMRRYGREADLAGVAAFLAGPDSSYITGQTIALDGGFTVY